VNGGDLGSAILSVLWLSPLLVLLTIWLIRQIPKDEASLLARARAAGEAV
jgi:hypothetical protein